MTHRKTPAPPQPVIYPEGVWRPVGKSMCFDEPGMGPSGLDIWLYKPTGTFCGGPCISRYRNWSGWAEDIKSVKEDGATMWCPCVEPNFPEKA